MGDACVAATWRLGLLMFVLIASPLALIAQSLTVRAVGDMLHVRSGGLGMIEGPVLDHLKDGRSVRVDVEVTILDKPKGRAITQERQSFNLSFDLWEQRLAVTRSGTAPRSVSHLTSKDAEAWCLDNVTVPVNALGRFGRDVPFWVRVDYRVQDQTPASSPEDDSTFTLRRLIDVLSRRRQDQDSGKSTEAGPFRLSN
jgi:hypothetical protein